MSRSLPTHFNIVLVKRREEYEPDRWVSKVTEGRPMEFCLCHRFQTRRWAKLVTHPDIKVEPLGV